MRILMMTNTYSPYTGGVERSIESFTAQFRQRGHAVMIVAPEPDHPIKDDDPDVFRVSAIKNFNDTNFPVTIPLPGVLTSRLEKFQPEVVHSHFPFIIGSAALRVAASYEIPLVFTYHTMYERYVHYVNTDSDRIRTFVKTLTAGYANLCDRVIAPSQAVEQILRQRGVEAPIEVIPTGVDTARFTHGDGGSVRRQYKIPEDWFVVGHVGRLASEKNLMFLLDAVSRFLKQHTHACCLIVGDGPLHEAMQAFVARKRLKRRVVFTGVLEGQTLVDAYHAMDLFAFSSTTETQGMVLAEAMAAGRPVVALEASGVTDILEDGKNGTMVKQEDPAAFAGAIETYFNSQTTQRNAMKQRAVETADHFSIDACAERVLQAYQKAIHRNEPLQKKDETVWQTVADLVKAEWDIFCNYLSATATMISAEPDQDNDHAA